MDARETAPRKATVNMFRGNKTKAAEGEFIATLIKRFVVYCYGIQVMSKLVSNFSYTAWNYYTFVES